MKQHRESEVEHLVHPFQLGVQYTCYGDIMVAERYSRADFEITMMCIPVIGMKG